MHTINTKLYTNATSYIFTEPDGLYGNQRYRRELLMMGTMVTETCWAYHKSNELTSGSQLNFVIHVSRWCTVQYTSNSTPIGRIFIIFNIYLIS